MMKKILFVQWDAFMQKGMENALNRLKSRMNFEYETFFYRFVNWDEDDIFTKIFEGKLAEQSQNARKTAQMACGEKHSVYDAVLTVNFSPLISDVCQKYGVIYLAWVYDCPLHIRKTKSLFNKCNRIFFFDKGQADLYEKQGVSGARHLELAADTDIYDKVAISEADKKAYECDVSLVGKLYKSDFSYLCGPLTQYQRGYLEGIISSQSQLYGGYILGELIDSQLMNQLNDMYRKASGGKFAVSKAELEFAMNCEITGRERYMALALLSNRHKVNVYTNDSDERLQNVHFGGYLDYYGQMPKAFKLSRINLNISLKAIQTGIPLRVFDVLACRGFLLTNYQEEIALNFEDGVELVMYSDVADLVAKAEYYLKHEDERLAIADNGYEKVKKVFTFDRQMEKILNELNAGE